VYLMLISTLQMAPFACHHTYHPSRSNVMIGIIVLRLRIENNNKHVRGKKRAIETIERCVLPHYGATRRSRVSTRSRSRITRTRNSTKS